MKLEDFMPRVTMVWADNPMPTTTVVLVPSHVDVEHESFQRAFGAHGENFLRESNHGGIVLAAVSVGGRGYPSMLGDALRFTIDQIHQGGFPLPVAGTVRHVFVDGTLDPVGGPMAVKHLLDQSTPIPLGPSAPTLTAAFLPTTAYGPFSHLTPFGQVPQPPPTALSGELIYIDPMVETFPGSAVVASIDAHLAAHNELTKASGQAAPIVAPPRRGHATRGGRPASWTRGDPLGNPAQGLPNGPRTMR